MTTAVHSSAFMDAAAIATVRVQHDMLVRETGTVAL